MTALARSPFVYEADLRSRCGFFEPIPTDSIITCLLAICKQKVNKKAEDFSLPQFIYFKISMLLS